MVRCWSCEAEVPEEAIAFGAHLMPRTSSRGGPLTLLPCPECGTVNLLERNPAGEVLLSPPVVRGYVPPDLRGADLARARRHVAEHGFTRATFLARRARPAATPPKVLPAPEPEPAPAPAAEAPEEDPAPVPAEVTGLLDAYAVLGLPLTATFAEVKNRYRSLSLRCHPDRVADLDDDIRAVAERKFRRLRSAFDLIARECPPERPGSR